MANQRWLLPEAIEDVLPREAEHLETLRRRLLDAFLLRGYDYVVPPMLEYVESLLTSGGHDMDLRTFKLVDQLSGRSMGVRADITPQVARIDAHLLNRQGVTRLCYCGSVLHTLPAGFNATREPVQVGAELYGHAGLEADIEIIDLLGEAVRLCNVATSRLDLGHVGIFRALIKPLNLSKERQEEIFVALQGKDASGIRSLVADVAEPQRVALAELPELYGDRRVLDQARKVLPASPEIVTALDALHKLAESLGDAPVSFDLADLRGYHYHGGLVFAAYCSGSPSAIAQGGRYDGVGGAYGRARPATGFSMDLREVARLSFRQGLRDTKAESAILAPCVNDSDLKQRIAQLRATGQRVMTELPGHAGSWREAGCDRILMQRDGAWVVEALKEE